MNWFIRFLINAIALWLIAKFVPGFNHDVSVWTALIAAIIFGLVNAIIGPVLRLITLPINWITHGVFSIVVNFILFWLTVLIAPNFKTTGSDMNPWLSLLIGAVIMMIVSTVVERATHPQPQSI